MAETSFLTTRTTEWSRGRSPSPLWTDPGDDFHKDFEEGQELPLEILGTISGPGSVMEKRRMRDGTLVAVKKLDTYQDDKRTKKLKNEVEVLRSLEHYHIVRILGTYTQEDSFSMVMKPCAWCNLYTYLSEPTSAAVKKMEDHCGPRDLFLPRIMGCLAHGLQYVHKEPRAQHNSDKDRLVRHRDIHPWNIVLDGPRVLYTDFGLSKFFTATQTGSSGPSHKMPMVKTIP